MALLAIGCLSVASAVLVGCASGTSNGASGGGPSESSGVAGSDSQVAGSDSQVVRGVAPYDYDSAIDEKAIAHLVSEQEQRYLAECVTRLGGVSTYEPTPAPTASDITGEVLSDFPDLDLLRERGRTLLIDPPDPSIRREDYATEMEYATALELANADRITSPDERELYEQCTSEPDFASEAGDARELHQSLFGAWISNLEEIDMSEEVDDVRGAFRDCVADGGMQVTPDLNEVTYWAFLDRELLDLATIDEMHTHNEGRGKLFAECAAPIYEVKDLLRREAHDRFVESHGEDISRLSDLLYGKGLRTDGG